MSLSLETRYFERMDAALGDKLRVVDYLPDIPQRPARIADMGAGSGQLGMAIARLADATVYGVDNHPDALARMSTTQFQPEGFSAVRGSFADLEVLAGPQGLDAVVCSAVLHEVFSYASATADPSGFLDPTELWAAWAAAISQSAAALRPGGRLIIRDGVAPDDPHVPAIFSAPDDDAAHLVAAYQSLSPFAAAALEPVSDEPGNRHWLGDRYAVAQALLTVTWGPDSLPREALELYALDTLSNYQERVLAAAPTLRPVHAEAYTQPGYLEALAPWSWADQLSGEVWPLLTNALWVFERV